MKSKIALLGVVLAAVLVMACPLPQFGPGQSRSAEDGGDQGTTGTSSISVVNDTERHQAVYINENGVSIDVVAEEYPGGPLVACVEVVDFTIVPPSTDPDALPVKVLVAGVRDDGSPGVWEIHADDSILLPQPEDTEDNAARSIVGSNISTLPDGVQTRFGWSFAIRGMALGQGGGIIAGVATTTRDVTIGGVAIPANTTLGIYWRVYSLPYTNFCIVSSPRIIGSLQPVTVPPRWRWLPFHFAGFRGQLKLYMAGKFQTYLTDVTENGVSLQGTTATVKGLDDQGKPADARIDRYGTISIEETLPELELSALAYPHTTQDFTTDSWTVDVTLRNTGSFVAKDVTLNYYLSTLPPDQFDRTNLGTTGRHVALAAPLAFPQAIAVGGSATYSASVSTTVSDLGFEQAQSSTANVTYYVYVFADAAPASNYGLDLGMSTGGSFAVANPPPAGGGDVLVLSLPVTSLSALRLTDSLSFPVNVTRNGNPDPAATLTFSVHNDATGADSATPSLTWDAATGVVSGYGFSLDDHPGTHVVSVVAHDGILVSPTATITIPVKYNSVVFDTYSPSGIGGGIDSIDLFGPGGTSDWLAYDDGNNNPDAWVNHGYIDISNKLELAPGTYYVRVQAVDPIFEGPYAIRVLIAPDPSSPRNPDWVTLSTIDSASDSQYEPDGAVSSGGIPTNAAPVFLNIDPQVVQADQRLFRYLDLDEVDWVAVQLP